jgi:hypothetical protein
MFQLLGQGRGLWQPTPLGRCQSAWSPWPGAAGAHCMVQHLLAHQWWKLGTADGKSVHGAQRTCQYTKTQKGSSGRHGSPATNSIRRWHSALRWTNSSKAKDNAPDWFPSCTRRRRTWGTQGKVPPSTRGKGGSSHRWRADDAHVIHQGGRRSGAWAAKVGAKGPWGWGQYLSGRNWWLAAGVDS